MIEKAPNWILWVGGSVLGLTSVAMLVTPDLVPVIDEGVMIWLDLSIVEELRRRKKEPRTCRKTDTVQ